MLSLKRPISFIIVFAFWKVKFQFYLLSLKIWKSVGREEYHLYFTNLSNIFLAIVYPHLTVDSIACVLIYISRKLLGKESLN